VYRIAHNLVVDQYRKRQPVPDLVLDESLLPSSEGDPAGIVENGQALEQLNAAIGRLTPEQQEVLALRYGEGFKAREVAQIMRKTTGAVEALQRRALAALRRNLMGDMTR
jgi:RNA polymerase sigma-70 factor (ECF subfamily)